MHHELAMRYLADQRSEQLMAQAERHRRAAGVRPTRSGLFSRLGRRVAARLRALVRPGPTVKSLDRGSVATPKLRG
jgi:hypothetical protein